MYTVVPENDLGKVCHVHQSLLKPRVKGEAELGDLLDSQLELPVQLVTKGKLDDAYVVPEVYPAVREGIAPSESPSVMVVMAASLHYNSIILLCGYISYIR